MQHIDRLTVRLINMFDMRHECECIYVEVDVYYRVSDKHFFCISEVVIMTISTIIDSSSSIAANTQTHT